jgi:hypothetical protein
MNERFVNPARGGVYTLFEEHGCLQVGIVTDRCETREIQGFLMWIGWIPIEVYASIKSVGIIL